MNQDAINEAQEKLDKARRQVDRATNDVRGIVTKADIAARAAYDLAHPPLERAAAALAANDAEIERLRNEGVSDDILAAMAVDSAQLRERIENAPPPMAPEAVAEIARRTSEIDAAVFEAAKAVGFETDDRGGVNLWVEMNPHRAGEIFTPAVVAMMQALGEYRHEVTPKSRQTEVKPWTQRRQGPIDPATGEHTYTNEIVRDTSMARIGYARTRYIQVVTGADSYAEEFSEMLAEKDEDAEAGEPAGKQMRVKTP